MNASNPRDHYQIGREDYSKPYGHIGQMHVIRWEDIELLRLEALVELPNAGGSDYSGSTTTASNYHYLNDSDEFEYTHLVVQSYGGHGTYQAFVRVIDLIENEGFRDAIREYCECVAEYPVFNDDHHSQYESDQRDNSWDNTIKDDFIRAVERKFDIELDDQYSDNPLRRTFESLASEANEYWENSEGDTMYISVDPVVEQILDIDEFLSEVS